MAFILKQLANNHKYINHEVDQQAKFMADQLELEINREREKHAKKLLWLTKEKEPESKKVSTTDPENSWLHKGDHK